MAHLLKVPAPSPRSANQPAHPEPRGGLQLVIDGPFAAIFWGKLCAAVGVWMHALVAAVVVYDQSGSATMVSVVSIAQFAPQLFLAPLVGKWADGGNKVRQIATGQVLCALGATGVAVVMLLDLEPGAVIAGVFSCTLVTGIGFVVSGPAMQTIVGELVRPGEFAVGMAVSTFPNTFGRLAGPALGAFATSTLEPALAFAASAALYATMIPLLVIATFPTTAAKVTDASPSSIRAGLGYVRRHRGLRLMLFATFAIAVASEPSLTLAPALSEHIGGDDAIVGWLVSGFGLGALAGTGLAVVAPRHFSFRPVATTGLVLLATGTGLSAVVPAAAWAVACFIIAGVGFALAIAGFSTLLQAHTDPHFRGRVTALWLIAFVGARPLTALFNGVVADVGGVTLAFATSGGVVLIAAWVTRPSALGPPAQPA